MLAALALLATPALAQDRTRVDLFDKEGRREGYVIVDEKTGQPRWERRHVEAEALKEAAR